MSLFEIMKNSYPNPNPTQERPFIYYGRRINAGFVKKSRQISLITYLRRVK